MAVVFFFKRLMECISPVPNYMMFSLLGLGCLTPLLITKYLINVTLLFLSIFSYNDEENSGSFSVFLKAHLQL